MQRGHLIVLVGFPNPLMLVSFKTLSLANIHCHWILTVSQANFYTLIVPMAYYQPLISWFKIPLPDLSLSFRCPSVCWISLSGYLVGISNLDQHPSLMQCSVHRHTFHCPQTRKRSILASSSSVLKPAEVMLYLTGTHQYANGPPWSRDIPETIFALCEGLDDLVRSVC